MTSRIPGGAAALALAALSLTPRAAQAAMPSAPEALARAGDLVETVQYRRGGGFAVGPRGGAVAWRGAGVRGPYGGAYRGGFVARGPGGAVVAGGRSGAWRGGYWGGGWRGGYYRRNYWPVGAVAAGAAIGIAGAAAASNYYYDDAISYPSTSYYSYPSYSYPVYNRPAYVGGYYARPATQYWCD